MKGLLIVDVQNDFCPGGALAVPNGDKVVPVINGLLAKFDVIVASKDWHPGRSRHFEKWPVHCVHNTAGAEFHPDLQSENIEQVFLKGVGDADDGYSAYEATNLNLEEFLKSKGIDELYVAGLATDYCVRASVLDGLRRGFQVYVVEDAVAAVNLQPTDGEHALKEMKKAGAHIVRSNEV